MRNDLKIIDCDRHVMEPADIWDKYLEPAYRHHNVKMPGWYSFGTTIDSVPSSRVGTAGIVQNETTPATPHQAENRTAFGGAHDDSRLARELTHGRNASRCRIFHTRITEGALVYLNEQINEWCDQQPDIEIKFASSTVGAFEGKQHVEHHLILTLFY